MVTTTSRAALDDDDNSDLYDPKYYPRKVVRDGKGIRTPLFLTDGRPDWMPPTKPDYARDAYRNYARNYQPHFYVGDSADPLAAERSYLERSAHLRDARRTGRGTGDAEIRDAREAAEAAYQARKADLADAWRGPGAKTPPAPKDGESPRDAYNRRIANAWKTPPGQPDQDDDADAIERQREAWSSPGATPSNNAAGGKTMLPAWPGAPGIGDASAALADAEKAREASRAAYVDRITNAWRRP